MEDVNSEQVFQYYTIINDPSNENNDEKEDSNNQVVYFTVDDVCDIKEPTALETCDNNSNEDDFVPPFSPSSNVQIITLEDGRVFMTTITKDANFESRDPHLITSSTNEQEEDVEEEGLLGNLNADNESCVDEKYEIVQVLDNSSQQMFEMVYCDPPSTQPTSKKEKSYVCLYEGCGKMYTMAHQLDVHMRNHLCFKPYACTEDGCDKTFSTNYSLKAHIRTHTGEKPYSCSICQKAFKTSGDLQKHVRIHTGEKPFMCPIKYCGKSFTTSNIRKVHVRSHTGERPYTCNYPNCGKAFSSSTNYKNHVRIHSGEKPYICQVKDCGKRFTEYSSLYKHNMVHQTDRPYSCRFCGQKFKQQSAMSLHKRVKHNIIIASDGTEIVVDIN